MQANLYGKYFNQRLIDILPTIQLKWIIIMMDKKRIEDIGEEDIAIINNLMMKIEERGV